MPWTACGSPPLSRPTLDQPRAEDSIGSGRGYPRQMLLAAIGDLVLDITIAPDGDLRTNDDTPASIRVGGGGQAANFCAWVASLGWRARLVTRVGDDDAGRRLVSELQSNGVDVHAVVAPEPTGAIAVLIGPAGERTMATQRGASTGLRPDELQRDWFSGARLLHLPAYSLFHEPIAGAAWAAVDMARDAGAVLAVDLSSVSGLVEYGPSRMVSDLQRLQPELLFATAAEAEILRVPVDRLAKVAVVKLGAAGCQVGPRRITAPPGEVVDPTGAGDALAAGLLVDGPALGLEAAARCCAKLGSMP